MQRSWRRIVEKGRTGPDRPWLISGDKEFTFAETEQLVGAAAGGLAGAGVSKGDVVLVVGRSFPAQVFTWLGLARLGAVMLPVNPSSTVDELVGFLDQVHPKLIVCDPPLDATIDDWQAVEAGSTD